MNPDLERKYLEYRECYRDTGFVVGYQFQGKSGCCKAKGERTVTYKPSPHPGTRVQIHIGTIPLAKYLYGTEEIIQFFDKGLQDLYALVSEQTASSDTLQASFKYEGKEYFYRNGDWIGDMPPFMSR